MLSAIKQHLKFFISLFIIFFLVLSCSLTDKLKEKLSGSNDNGETNEKTKEDTKEVTSGDDIAFYNKYIAVSNKIQAAGDKVQKNYFSDIPEPSSVSKSSFILAVGFSLAVDELERVNKEYKRSYYDGGELSKLNAAGEMKQEIESNLEKLLTAMEDYHSVARKTADFYKSGDYKKNPSNAAGYDADMKAAYEKYKTAFDRFSDSVRKYKPKRVDRDPNSISNPDERSVAVLMNSYENTLDAAEEFYNEFSGIEFKGNLTRANEKFGEFKTKFADEKNSVLSAEFSDKTKYMKYSYEDYFVKMSNMFIDAGNKFFDDAPNAKNERDFNSAYDKVVNNYNYMITAYNTNINIVNSFKVY